MPYVAPPSIPGDWYFEIIRFHGPHFYTVKMMPRSEGAIFATEGELVGHGFVLNGIQHRILRVITFITMVVETQGISIDACEEPPASTSC